MASKNGLIRNKGGGVPVYVRIPLNLLKRIDRAVSKGIYVNRSEAIRSGARILFGPVKKRAAGGLSTGPEQSLESSAKE